MKKHKTPFLRFMWCCLFMITTALTAHAQFSGNPLFKGADPEMHYFNGKYYIYTTTVNGKQFHAYSSLDLMSWKDEGVIFDIGPQCTWAETNGWAPGVVYRNNKYYFYYSAEVKIGVAVGNTPIGPFTDLGYPFIGTDPYTDDIIDAMVFIDDDGQAYIYYGGSGKRKMVVRKLNPDMVSFASGPSNITPENYTEGPYMVKRNGVYYMTYSNGAWYNDTYNVQYSTSNSPTGPWTYRGKILSSNGEDLGPGHHSVFQVPGCDDYYMVYHRYENGLGQARQVCIDRMYFNASGLIDPVNMTNYGVMPRVPDNSCMSQGIVSGGIYKLTHKGTNQCLDVANNSAADGANVQQWTDNGNDAQRWVVTLEADGFYKLTHKGTDRCLDVDNNSAQAGTNVQQWHDNGSDAQRWKIEVMEDGYCKLTHKGTNKCLDVGNNSSQPGANVAQWTDNGNNAQRWRFELIEAPIVSGGIYRLTHKGTNQCLDVAGNTSQAGANVQQWTDNGVDGQRWVITKENDGYYKLTHKGTNKCLDVGNNSSQAGANVAQWTDNGNDAQRWKIELQSDGYFKLTHKNTTQCLDVSNNSSEPGTNVGQWNDNGSDAQRWKLDLMQPVTPVNGNGDGLTGNYFNGMNFETPVLTRKDASIDFGWGNGSPDAAVHTNQFSVRWTGQVQPRYSGEYTFFVNSDNGRRLWVNGQLIIDEWIDNWNIDYYGKIILTAGKKYDIKLEYFENTGGAGCKLSWSSIWQAKEVIPTSQLYASTEPDNLSPSVSLTSPVANTSLDAPATISIAANASDPDGTIAKVEFYNGSQKLGEKTSSPYVYTWSNVVAGTYSITAKATDNKGASSTSSAVSVTVKGTAPNQSPTVSLTSPSANASYNAPATVSIAANASDPDGTIAKVEFYNGSQKLGEKTSAPYTYNWTNVAAGSYSLTAKATDNEGATKTSSAVSITVKTVVSDPCSGIAPYTENGGYVEGSKVKNSGKQYQCKPWPYSGWCNGAAWAYAPGTGAYWSDAWTLLGSCGARQGEELDEHKVLTLTPNPATDVVYINNTRPVTVTVLSQQGNEVLSLVHVPVKGMIDLSALSAGLYIVRMQDGETLVNRILIKQ